MARYTLHHDFASSVFNLVGVASVSTCSVNVELDPSIEWLCGHFEGNFEAFRTRWEEVLNSPNIVTNYNVRPTSNWQGQSKTYSFNGDHLIVRFDSKVAGQEVSISIRVNSQAAFQSDTPSTPALQSPIGQPILSNAQAIIESSMHDNSNTESTNINTPSTYVSNTPPSNCINLNTASVYELRLIAFINEAKANEIATRRSIQAYRSIDELIYVTGMDEAQMNEIRTQNLACVQ